jgi:hypothetical protein
MAFSEGWLIDGTNYQYKIVKEIGVGGFGITYLAKRNDGLNVQSLSSNLRSSDDSQFQFDWESLFVSDPNPFVAAVSVFASDIVDISPSLDGSHRSSDKSSHS